MVELRFKGRIRMVGNSYGVTVPKAIADLLDKEKEYTFVILEKQ